MRSPRRVRRRARWKRPRYLLTYRKRRFSIGPLSRSMTSQRLHEEARRVPPVEVSITRKEKVRMDSRIRREHTKLDNGPEASPGSQPRVLQPRPHVLHFLGESVAAANAATECGRG